jgi:AcrR family transcriptional regulator
VRDGFHATSMQDIQRASGLSAGAIYLYFRSKQEIVTAIAQGVLGTIVAVFEIPPADAPRAGLDDLLTRFLTAANRLQEERQLFAVILPVWAEALRDPAMHAVLIGEFAKVRDKLVRLLVDYQEHGMIDRGVDVEALAMAVVGGVQGYIIQTTLLPHATSLERYLAGMLALMRSGSGDPA